MIYLKKYMIVPSGTTEEDEKFEEGDLVRIEAGEIIKGEIIDLNDSTVTVRKKDDDKVGVLFEEIDCISALD